MRTKVIGFIGGIFEGRNFMTPNLIEYRKGKLEGGTVYIEISEGEFLGNTRYGVTFRRCNGKRLENDPSGMKQSIGEVMEFLEQL